MCNNTDHAIELNGAKITPAIIKFIRQSQEDDGEKFRSCIESIRELMFYAIRRSIESKEFESIQSSTVNAIYFLDELKAFDQ